MREWWEGWDGRYGTGDNMRWKQGREGDKEGKGTGGCVPRNVTKTKANPTIRKSIQNDVRQGL